MCIYNSLLCSFYIAVLDFHSKCIADSKCSDTDIVSTSPENAMKQPDLSMYLFILF